MLLHANFQESKICLPFLKKGKNPHILNLSPPLNMNPFWFKNHLAYTMAKYGMSMCVLGMSEEYKDDGIAVNALWPRTAIATAAIEMLSGKEANSVSRKPEIMADAAYAILCQNSKTCTGNFFIDEDILKKSGVTNLEQYAVDPSNINNLMPDFFLDIPEQTETHTGSVEKNNIEVLFEKIQANLTTELVSKTNAVYHFVVKGKLKPAGAFMTGKLKIKGNLQKAMKLEKMMGLLKSKL
ncbi:Hydroxysteroid dehydrogenase-like protein 2 [Blattella germanica]|nr:Hydroxysteroid dehydrogenase-like protein 2 [Blattella germanica]